MTPQQAGFQDHLSWLQCGPVKQVYYLPDAFAGYVEIEEDNCTNSSVIQMFMEMDANVQLILTIAGPRVDSMYFRLRNRREPDPKSEGYTFNGVMWGAFIRSGNERRFTPSSLSLEERKAGESLLHLAMSYPAWAKQMVGYSF